MRTGWYRVRQLDDHGAVFRDLEFAGDRNHGRSIKSPLCVTYDTEVKEHTAIDDAPTPCEAASAASTSDAVRSSPDPTRAIRHP
jgi:hypothetical protein